MLLSKPTSGIRAWRNNLEEMASNLVQLQVHVLAIENYEKWCIQFKAIFSSQDLWDIVSNDYTEPTPNEEGAYTP